MNTTTISRRADALKLSGGEECSPNLDYALAQERLLRANRSGTIFDAMERHELSYDDITYSDGIRAALYGDRPVDHPLRDCPKLMSKAVPVISCFSGAGGFDVGAAQAGYKTLLAVDIDKHACETLRNNKTADVVVGPPDFSGDLHDLTASLIANLAKVRKPFEGLMVGGPPCQPFSLAANQRFSKSGANFKRIGFKDKRRGTLLDRYANLLVELRPAAFILENVRGLMDIDGGKRISLFREQLQKRGYTVSDPLVLNAVDFGVPQYRERLFIVGNRLGKKFEFSLPQAATKRRNVIDVLAHVPETAPNHVARDHAVSSILRYRGLAFGAREQMGRVDRLHPFRPSKTVIAGGTKGGGRSHLHPFVPRTLTVRECARLQTFPDDHVFTGPSARQFTQVGNAIPPLLAYCMAASVYRTVFR